MESVLHLHEFFVEGSTPQVSHVLLNITEPSTPAEKEKGYFFAICEINNADIKYIAKIQNIIDEIENDYYEIPDQPQQSAMEIILDKINLENTALTQQPEISLHCIAGAIRENDIIFSFHGNPQMVLFYKTKDGFYKKMDLINQNKSMEQSIAPLGAEEGDEVRKNQLFCQIIQGKIGPNDIFFTGTPHIIEYFNHDRLQKIITTRPPRQSSEHLQRVLSELRNNLSFGGIIISLQQKTNAPVVVKSSPAKKGGSARSLKNLFSTEQKTANILFPSFLPRFQDKIKNTAFAQKESRDEASAEADTELYADTEISSSHLRPRIAKLKTANGLNLKEFLKKIFTFIWKMLKFAVRGAVLMSLFIGAVFSTIARNLLMLFFIITNYQNRRRNILTEWTRWWLNIKENAKRLPLATKILLCLSLVLLLIFSGGIVYAGTKQKNQARAAAYAAAIQTIKAKTEAAESSLIYGDSDIALSTLKEAEQIIKKLSCLSASEKINCQNLQTALDKLMTKARKAILTHPQMLADWNNLTLSEGGESLQINNIFLLKNKIYGFGQTGADLAAYDLLTKESKIFTPGISVKNFTAASVPKENDYAVLLYDDKNIAQFKPQDNSWRKVDTDYSNQNAKITAIFIYNRRLYSLDAQNNQIYKHDPIKTGFSTGKEWLKTSTANLGAGVDLTIDGDVFALEKNGAISKFTNGSSQPFAISGLDPQLASANKIWTYNDLNYIYILDVAGKRIILLDKTGRLKTQLIADEFISPTAMIVDEQKNTAYVLDSNKLYRINLQ